MDSAQILQIVSEFGALGLASAAIFWVFIKTSKRLDQLTDNFQSQLREQAEECNKREGAGHVRLSGAQIRRGALGLDHSS